MSAQLAGITREMPDSITWVCLCGATRGSNTTVSSYRNKILIWRFNFYSTKALYVKALVYSHFIFLCDDYFNDKKDLFGTASYCKDKRVRCHLKLCCASIDCVRFCGYVYKLGWHGALNVSLFNFNP